MKKLYLLSIGIAVLYLLLAVYHAALPIYTGTITEITRDYYTHGAGDDLRRYYNESVTVDTGERVIENVRVTRSHREELPQAGDSIQVFGTQRVPERLSENGEVDSDGDSLHRSISSVCVDLVFQRFPPSETSKTVITIPPLVGAELARPVNKGYGFLYCQKKTETIRL